MKTVKEYLDIINSALAGIKYPEKPSGLYEPIAYTLDCGGKRIRPMLVLSVVDALGAECDRAINQAIGLEMFHNFTLLHDDVMDKSEMRRKRPTVHVKWNEATAILSGDAMLTMATQFMMRGCDGNLGEILDLFNTTAMEIYEGQQFDMDFESRVDVTAEEYIEMIRLKTSVLLGCACKAGAIMAGAGPDVCESFYDFGVWLGLAFQLQDDWLDTYGDPEVFGKKIGGDILNDKKTLLLITALERASADRRDELFSLFGNRGDDKIKRVMAIYGELDVESRCRGLIEEYSRKAVDVIEMMPLSAESKKFFKGIVGDALNRKL